MKKILPDLWQSNVEMRFSTLKTHAYLLVKETGNILLYTTNNIDEIIEIQQLGGAKLQLLSHCHEVDASQNIIKKTLGSKLGAHERVAPYLADNMQLDIAFSADVSETILDGVTAIPTPGHTDNSVCYHYASPFGKRYLFVGDVLYWDNDRWRILIVPSDGGRVTDMVESLQMLRKLVVDVLITSVALDNNRDATQVKEVNQAQWHNIIDDVLETLVR